MAKMMFGLLVGGDYESIIDAGGIDNEAPHEDPCPTFSPFLDDGDGIESFVGYTDNEEEEEDDDKDFISDFLSSDNDSEEVPLERANKLSTDLSATDGIPPTMTCYDTDKHPTVHQDVNFLSWRLQPLS
jgi:hypothetical protein